MRILIIDTWYPEVLRAHYAETPALRHDSYADQWASLMKIGFGTADSYSHYLRLIGHEAHEIIVNCEPLQKAWGKEHRVNGGIRSTLRRQKRRPEWRNEVLLAQVEAFSPDCLYVQDLWALPVRTLRTLRESGLGLVGQLGCIPPNLEPFPFFDLVLALTPSLVAIARDAGAASELWRGAFDPRALAAEAPPPRDLPLTFVGSLAGEQWQGAAELLERVARDTPIQFWGYGAEHLSSDSLIRARYNGEAWGHEMLRIMARTRIALNRHGDSGSLFSCNYRLFEATGMGAMVLTETTPNIGKLFEPGLEVVTYDDADDLIEKIWFYLDDEAASTAVAEAGQARTLEEHTYARRMSALGDILVSYFEQSVREST